jgi:hypothetical protein
MTPSKEKESCIEKEFGFVKRIKEKIMITLNKMGNSFR